MDKLQSLVAQLVAARQQLKPMTYQQALDLSPSTVQQAYQVQGEVAKQLGWFKQGGLKLWKLGGELGHSSAAALDDSLLSHHQDSCELVIPAAEACSFSALELELAVRLKQPLAYGCNLSEAKAAIGEVYLALEVCDLRADNWQQLPSLYRLADHQMNRRIILLGSPLIGWDEQYSQIAPVIKLGEQTLSRAKLTHPQGHPLAALPWLANLSQALYQQPLAAGSIIATGTWAGLQTLTPATPFFASLEGFAPVQVRLEASSTLS